MDTNRQPQKRPWIIAGLLMLALLSTAMTGCDRSTVSDSGNSTTSGTVNSTTSGTVNSTFVDVNGLLTAPTKVAASYPTEELNLGNDSGDGLPQFLDGMTYTFTYHSNGNDEDVWTTAWERTTGKKLWSVLTNAAEYTTPYATFSSDGKHLFFIRRDPANNFRTSIVCLDKTTGVTVWEYSPITESPFSFNALGSIVLHINSRSHMADRIYMIGEEAKYTTLPPITAQEERRQGIWIWDAATGKVLDRINWPALSTLSGNGGQLLCDGTTLYASIPESTEAEYPAQKSSLVAFDLTTNKLLWQESVDGEGVNLVKQGNVLTFVRTVEYSDRWIDVWQISTDGATRLWTRQAEGTPEEGSRTSFAIDSSRIYLQGSKGIFRALDLVTGKEVWRHQFAPTKEPITDGPDVGKMHDTYLFMTLTTTRDVLYVEDGGGLVAAFEPATGKELWSKRISDLQYGQTAVHGMYVLQFVDKGFYVIFSDGKVTLWN